MSNDFRLKSKSAMKQNLFPSVEGIGVRISNSLERNLVKHTGARYSWDNPTFVSVLSRSETPLGAEWIEEGHAKAMEFLTKKRSQERLAEEGVTDLIQLWI